MKIEVAKHERMSETGSSLIRLIQNNELPLLDLLVRESIQNSSDAKKKKSRKININFNTGEFQPRKLNRHFEGINEILNKKFITNQQYLEIRDSNTTGLTGPLHHSKVEDNQFGNLINLVYEISKPQQKEGAGGSWGLGKTIYFRLGIGIVLYYSRIKTHNGFESRLAACLVENEKSEDAILPKIHEGPKRGIAWWGEELNAQYTIPLTNENEIITILNDIGVKSFEETETGTSIIIPYINKKQLLKGAHSVYQKNIIESLPWLSTLEDYLIASIQKWYAPRINNPGYKIDCMINPSVNDHAIFPKNMYPIYQVQIDLYNYSTYSKSDLINLIVPDNKIDRQEINLNNTFIVEKEAGQVVYAILEKENLKMIPPYNYKSPHLQLNVSNYDLEHENTSIISYCRKPGMIIDYDGSGLWSSKIINPNDKEFLIGLFIPNSINRLNKTYGEITLEEYLRKSEKADHRSWGDWMVVDRNPQIVSKIVDHIARKINKKMTNENSGKYEIQRTSIGKNLASILLPPEDFGKSPTRIGNKRRGNGDKKTRKSIQKTSFMIKSTEIDFQNNKVINFELFIAKQTKTSVVDFRIESENGNIHAEKWEGTDGVGLPFPYSIDEIDIKKIILNENEEKNNPKLQEEYQIFEYLSIEKLETEIYARKFGFKIEKKISGPITINGRIKLSVSNDDFAAVIYAKDIEGDNYA